MKSRYRNCIAALCILMFTTRTMAHPSTEMPRATICNAQEEARSLLFTENKGQIVDNDGKAQPSILFSAGGQGFKIFLAANAIHYQFQKTVVPEGYEPDERKVKDHVLQDQLLRQVRTETHHFTVNLENANPHPRIKKEARNLYTENFYLPQCPDGILYVRTYGKIILEDVYHRIDWVIYATKEGLKYDFIVHPGGDPEQIKLKVNGAEKVELTENGSVNIKTSIGSITEAAPKSFIDGLPIASRFALKENQISFRVENRDPTKTLTIDPSVSWATYYGDGGIEYGASTSVDAADNVYLAGQTTSTTIAANGHQNTRDASYDAFLVKFNKNGNRLWATYYGGNGYDEGHSCATDKYGNVFLAGRGTSTNAIGSGGFQNSNGGAWDAFLVKFDSTGARRWGTFYGGNYDEWGRFCATDRAGNVYLTGYTGSSSGIGSNGFKNTLSGTTIDAFLVKFDSSGNRIWGTYYGGTAFEDGFGCATDSSGNIYLSGVSYSIAGISSGGFQNVIGGNHDAFLVKFNTNGNRLWATYYGGFGDEENTTCATDVFGNVYLTGHTTSTNAIANGGFQNQRAGGYWEAFLVQFDSTGNRRWGTYYGGPNDEYGFSCATDDSGNIYLAGSTNSLTGIASGGFQNQMGGTADPFLVKFDNAGARIWGTYLGGSNDDAGKSCATDSKGDVYLAGTATSTSGIATTGSFQNAYIGSNDAFLAKVNNVTIVLDTIPQATFCAGARFNISFTCSRTSDAGNVYTAQLSDASGSFATPVIIGTLSGSALSGNILIRIPANTITGNAYRIRVIASSPSVTGLDNGVDLSIIAQAVASVSLSANPPGIVHAGNPVVYTAAVTNAAVYTLDWYVNRILMTTTSSPVNIYTRNSTVVQDTVTVKLKVTGCYSDTVYTSQPLSVMVSTGILSETESANLQIFPNPANEVIRIRSQSGWLCEIQLSNCIGQILDTTYPQGPITDLRLGKYPPGVYQLTVITRRGAESIKQIRKIAILH